MTEQNSRQLILLRHAKSAWPEADDHDRPLAPRGRRDAPAAGRWLRDADYLPNLVVCSTASRARQTWALAAGYLGCAPQVINDPRIYDGDVPALLVVVRETPEPVRTLLLVGHNPGLQELTLRLAGEAAGDALRRAQEKFPTSAIAVLTWQGPWSQLVPGAARLAEFAVPRGKPPSS
ncbi:SixA phosphatase family protein [Streptomyces inhibens]|uniref:SixA phosphatase family protein n=1 Tax=Streptomyces inhibens TaxID=2293571 RepID=UPI001EE71503|nr:histidine phosphatase family protein [Streptomyces inhibens]UKY48534.1 histidine phosphatase family protein [Streptomyces inhibens]